MKHLAWKDVVQASSSEPQFGMKLLGRTLDLTDRGGVVHKIPFADIPNQTRWLDMLGTLQYCTEAKMENLTPQLYNDARDFVVHLWSYGQLTADQNKTRRIVNGVIVLFAVGWLIEFFLVDSTGPAHSFFSNGMYYAFFQFIKFLPLLFLPIYAHSAPVSQIRCTPEELRCEAIVGGHTINKRKIRWNDIKNIELSPEQPNQLLLDRELRFNKKDGSTYKLKLEHVGSAANWRELLSSIYYSSGIQVEQASPNLFDQVNPDQKDPSYTQIWLDSLLAPAQRKKLLQLESGIALQNGKYVLDRKLGAGGQGAAYLARRDDGVMVVLKEYILPIYVDAKVKRKSLENFENEARMLQQLDSPLIVKLLGFFVEDHRGYLVLEHIDGINLREHIAQNGPLSEQQVIHYGILMCNALLELHSQHPPIVHRDFTPDNIVLSGEDSIKIIDFMVAQQNDDTATGTVVGKHAYLPPEQFRGKANPQSDIYALGCSLFYLLTATEPEPLTTTHPILTNDTVSGALDEIVAKATELECSARYKFVTELKADLLRLKAKNDPQQDT
jgi:tRNA A-37 threonylcarbamoyl transferase component Bud32